MYTVGNVYTFKCLLITNDKTAKWIRITYV